VGGHWEGARPAGVCGQSLYGSELAGTCVKGDGGRKGGAGVEQTRAVCVYVAVGGHCEGAGPEGVCGQSLYGSELAGTCPWEGVRAGGREGANRSAD